MKRPLLVTLDHNCIIARERQEASAAEEIKQLINFHNAGIITLNISSARGEENSAGEMVNRDWQEQVFHEADRAHLTNLGLGSAELYTYLRFMRFTDGKRFFSDIELDNAFSATIHDILLPEIEYQTHTYWVRCCQSLGVDVAQ